MNLIALLLEKEATGHKATIEQLEDDLKKEIEQRKKEHKNYEGLLAQHEELEQINVELMQKGEQNKCGCMVQ